MVNHRSNPITRRKLDVFKKQEKPIVAKRSLRPDSVKHPEPVDVAGLTIAKQCVEALKQLIGKEA